MIHAADKEALLCSVKRTSYELYNKALQFNVRPSVIDSPCLPHVHKLIQKHLRKRNLSKYAWYMRKTR